jgi:hypothetical protein
MLYPVSELIKKNTYQTILPITRFNYKFAINIVNENFPKHLFHNSYVSGTLWYEIKNNTFLHEWEVWPASAAIP